MTSIATEKPSHPSNRPFRRTAPKALTIPAINGLKLGAVQADGAIRPGSGSLKARKRKTAGAPVIEWLFVWHREGKTSTLSLGRFSASKVDGCLTLEQARDEARRLQEMVRTGGDPAAQREIDRADRRVQQAAAVTKVREESERTLMALLRTYVASLREKGKDDTAYDVENLFANHVERAFPALAMLPAAQINPEHISRILARLVGAHVVAKKGRTALKLRSFMAAAFKLALGASIDPMAPAAAAGFGLTFNPAAAVPSSKMAAAFNRSGQRVLTNQELRHYLSRVAALPSDLTRLALQLQIATAGQRVKQLLRLSHSDVTTTITLFDPKGRRTQPRPHVLPLVPEVAELVDALRDISPTHQGETDGPLFRSGDALLNAETLSSAVLDISTAMVAAEESKTPFRGGDIRRTVETMLAETLGLSKDARAQLLSHGLTGVQERHYDKGQHLESKRAALRVWNDYLADLCIGNDARTTSNVTTLKRAA